MKEKAQRRTGGELASGHDWHSSSYVSEWIESHMTRDAERRVLLRRVATLISAAVGGPVRVLDVGAGYGTLSGEILDQCPEAVIVVHDYSDPMIAVARERLAQFGNRVAYKLADMTETGWTAHLGGPFDVAVSALAIHNLGGAELIRQVYSDIFSVLRPGGCLFNLDLIFPEGRGLADLYRRDPTRDSRWDIHIRPAGLQAHLGWLQEAGFGEVDCVWKDLEQGLLWGLRSG